MPTLGSRIKRLRLGLGLSQYELARKTNLTQATLSRLEAGKMFELKSAKLRSLASALRVSVDFLLGETESQKVEDVIAKDTEARLLVSAYAQMDASRRKQLRDFAAFLMRQK